MLEQAFD